MGLYGTRGRSSCRSVRKATGCLCVGVLLMVVLSAGERGQRDIPPQNNAANPFMTEGDWVQFPRNRSFGSSGGIDMDVDGIHVWVAERCGGNSCAASTLDPILKLAPDGSLITSFGGGMFNQPHGLHVDQDGHIWVTDSQGPTAEERDGRGKGHVVMKFSADGELLLTLGVPGVGKAGTATLDQPCDVVVADDGTIFVADGHGGQQPEAGPHTTARIVKYAADGTYLMEWGSHGEEDGQFRTPHAIDIDSEGRIVVADRGNDRLQVFTADGTYIESFYQYSRPSGLVISSDDTVYVADSASSRNGQHLGWEYGIRIGSLKTGSLDWFIKGSNPEGVAVAADGTVYGAVVSDGGGLLRYVR